MTALSSRQYKTVVVWFRRDLRVSDHAPLSEACAVADEVVPLFVLDSEILRRTDTGGAKIAFLLDALRILDKNLQGIGGRLIIRRGKTPDTLIQAANAFKADAVFFHDEYEPFGRERDKIVTGALRGSGIASHSYPGLAVTEPVRVLSHVGTPYTVFTPYKNTWLNTPNEAVISVPKKVTVPKDIVSEPLPTLDELKITVDQTFECGGEDRASQLLMEFTSKNLSRYAQQRDFPSDAGTSHLSAHIHLGTISARTVVERTRKHDLSSAFLTEIAWRDFYLQILYHFPAVAQSAFKPQLNNIAWEDDPKLFDAWCSGKTGYPFVDAAMRELNQHAWMHNRARMVVASFLTKDLLIDWRHGELYFMQKLADGDQASNNGGWQWSAGTGTDAQPFFRIFNPVTQGEKFDPDGEYVRKYVPELRKLPNNVIHSPWKLTSLEQEACGCVLGKNYPFPVVEHSARRQRALEIYRASAESYKD